MSILRYLGLSLILLAFAACGSTGTTTPDGDADVLEDASTEPDATTPPPPPTCERLTCADLVKDGRVPCGIVSGTDGCGGTLACADAGDANNGCPEGFYCQGEDDGVARCQERTAEECTTRVDEADACDGVCGSVPTGCYGETYNCGGCDEGFFCQGGSCRANACTTQRDCTNAGPGGTAVSCGVWGDGCGSTIDCTAETGGCGAGEVCDPSGACVVDAPPECLLTAADACAGTCGVVSNGCDGTYNCADEGFGCPGGTICGVANPGDTPTCGSWDTCTVDTTALVAQCAGKCGFISDGCDGVFNCSAPGNGGLTCSAPNTCGGGGVHNTCGVPANSCVPEPEATTCANRCGPVNNNCGEIVQCGGCPAGESCGNGGAFTCGPTACSPINAAAACAGKCGSISDGCDGEYNCADHGGIGSCPFGEACGYNGVENTCGGPGCTARTCAEANATCGTTSNNCGGVINCWPAGVTECADPLETCQTTSGGAQECSSEGGTGGCQGPLCAHVPTCPAGTSTRIVGYVTTPDGELRVPNAVVYIPRDPSAALPPIREGVDPSLPAELRCDRCTNENDGLGPVLAGAISDHEGRFVLTGHIPTDTTVKVVVKAGRWRGVSERVIPTSYECVETTIPASDGLFKLPGRHAHANAEDHLPHIAVSTGRIDAMECVLLKMGVDISEFTTRNGDGRIHMYRANGGRMASPGGQCRRPTGSNNCGGTDTQLFCNASEEHCTSHPTCRYNNSQCRWQTTSNNIDISVSSSGLTDANANNGDLYDYDMVLWDCERSNQTRSEAPRRRIRDYANSGGRFFASHYARDWLNYSDTFGSVMTYGSDVLPSSDRVYLSFARPRRNDSRLRTYARWLDSHNAATVLNDGNGQPRFGFMDPVREPRDTVQTVASGVDEWMFRTTNNTESDAGSGSSWPPSNNTSVQQFSFNTPYNEPANACGRIAYTAFHVVSAGGQMDVQNQYFPSYCLGGDTLSPQEKTLAYMIFDLASCISEGEPPQPPECEPATAAECGPNSCGIFADGCGGTYNCGGCATGEFCSMGGVCTSGCTPMTCASEGYECGTHSDGCSGVTANCGTCESGEICGLYEPGQCGGCEERTCAEANAECGSIANGCGGYTECGSDCPEGQVCGGGGVPNQCGSGSCDPTQCKEWHCGTITDGCGGFVNCGGCAEGEACGIVEANHCSVICEAETLEEACAGLQCGYVADGCGGSHYCGDCTNGGECGGAGANMCGEPCPATTCAAEGANCGFIQDGCGTLLDCGTCTGSDVCGASAPNVCGAGTCAPSNACPDVQDVQSCGTISDGCDGQIECGDCPAGSYCSNDNICVPGEGACEPDSCEYHNATCGSPPDGCGGQLDCGTCPSGQICGFPVAYTCGGGAG